MLVMTKRKVIRIPSPRERPDPPDDLTEVYRARDQAEALVVKGLLESNGISCALRTQIVQSVHPFSVADLGAVQILVVPRDRADAIRLLSADRHAL